jgi:Lar family restriction alleviation protein
VKLKPCPFCGEISKDAEGEVVCIQPIPATFMFVCPGCYAGGPMAADVRSAISAWNSRAKEK